MTTARNGNALATWLNVHRLQGSFQKYQWGSKTLLAELRGTEPTGHPEAEIWYGAHPDSPTLLSDGSSLLEHIANDPLATLGDTVAASFDGQLPFLLKLLAAGSPLSIQAHPTTEQALAGFEREDAAGVARDAPNRSFRDQSHKPELIVAVTSFEALVGFRAPEETALILRALGVDDFADRCERDSPLDVVGWLLAPPPEEEPEVASVVERLSIDASNYSGEVFVDEVGLLTRIAAEYPGDPGLAVAALLNRLVLEPGEGIYLDAGTLHAYIGGLGVELMANSNNVLRGGLTPKHIDEETLLQVLTDETGPCDLTIADEVGRFSTPTPEFALTTIAQQGITTGPAIVLSVSGTTSVVGAQSAGAQSVELSPTEAVWLDADETVEITTTGLAYVAQVGG